MEEKKTPDRLGFVLDSLVCDRDWQYRLGINRVFLFWQDVVGNEIAGVAQPDVVKGDVLWVRVPDSMWMQELHLAKMGLLEKINKRLRQEAKKTTGVSKLPALSDIRFTIRRKSREEISLSGMEEDKAILLRPVDPEREGEFDALLASIKDREVAKKMKRLWLGQEKRPIDTSGRE